MDIVKTFCYIVKTFWYNFELNSIDRASLNLLFVISNAQTFTDNPENVHVEMFGYWTEEIFIEIRFLGFFSSRS